MEQQKNYGYKPEPIIENKDYIFGGFTKVAGAPINESANWRAFIPEKEIQVINYRDSFACGSFGTLNCLEMIGKFLGIPKNWSDRFLAIASGTLIGVGNSPQKVAETLRKIGVCPELSLPLTAIKSVEEFYQPDPLPSNLKEEAEKEFVFNFDFRHEYVFQGQETLEYKQNQLKEALKRSPVGISVSAWYQRNGKFYKPDGISDNHWVALIGYKDKESWIIYDSAEQDIKELEWDYSFGTAKVYYLVPVSPEEQERRKKERLTFLGKILKIMAKILSLDFEWLKINATTPATAPESQKTNDTTPIEPLPEAPITPEYEWDTPEKARHSVRLICDKEELNVAEKNLISQVINCESGYKINATHKNTNGTTDYGIIQINDFYWIGKDKKFPSVQYVLDNSEVCVRWMIEEYKKGHLNWWMCYKTGKFKQFLA